MNRIEFMKELEYLLQDIPEEDKADALDYYRDYLEEAGDEDEQTVLDEFGSPERIAAIIRADLSGNLKDGGEFTDRGYQDSRYADPRYQVARRLDLPEETADSVNQGTGREKQAASDKKPSERNGWKIACWILLAIIGSPLIISAVAVLFSALVTVVSVVASLALVLVILIAVFGIVGVALIGYGFSQMFIMPLEGTLIFGTGLLLLGLALLLVVVAALFFGKLVPAGIRLFADLMNRLFHRRGGVKA